MIMGIGYLISTMNGFDSSLMGAINAMKPYQESFGLTGAGNHLPFQCLVISVSATSCLQFHKLQDLQPV